MQKFDILIFISKLEERGEQNNVMLWGADFDMTMDDNKSVIMEANLSYIIKECIFVTNGILERSDK
jgi:hypothetical protein